MAVERKMFMGASHLIFANARSLRNNQTKSESLLWNYLKERPHGLKFRRQHPINTFIADFYCHSLQLIIEADGGIHDVNFVKQYDKERQQYLEDQGISFLRFSNEDIENNFEIVKTKIEHYITDRIAHGFK